MANKKTKNQKLKERTQKAKLIAAGKNINSTKVEKKGLKNLFYKKG